MGKINNLNKYFDHTILRADATTADIKKLCAEAGEYDFYSVCVNSCYVPLAASELESTEVKVAAVVGFPLGAMSTDAKAFETDYACENGADEIDMVINVGALKEGNLEYVLDDICAVIGVADEHGAVIKVILETCLLTEEEIVTACNLAMEAGADFVKTSTGFSTGGATEHHIELMKKTVETDAKIKASGSIRDLETVIKMIEAGADRIGASASVAIMEEYRNANTN